LVFPAIFGQFVEVKIRDFKFIRNGVPFGMKFIFLRTVNCSPAEAGDAERQWTVGLGTMRHNEKRPPGKIWQA
jgi:hypothetical protein